MKKSKQGFNTISNEKGELIAVIKRDDTSGKHIVYKVVEATSDDIADLIVPDVFIEE